MSNRPGPARTHPARLFVARAVLLLTVSFLLAGAGLLGLMSLGFDPFRTAT